MSVTKFPPKIVLVSENCDEIDTANSPENITSLEMTNVETTSYIVKGLKSFIDEVEIATNPAELSKYANQDVLVMSVYGGENSRNRMALVPAICEAYGISYMGADAYARILCQDKHLSKIYAKEIGLESSPSVLVRYKADIQFIKLLKLPLVVKPNLEGSSIGIGESSLVYTHSEAETLTENLLERFQQPILVEQFISGKEVSFCLAGTQNKINFFVALEDTNKNDPDFFADKLYTADLKQNSWADMIHIDITSGITGEVREVIEKLFWGLGKIDYLRVDCRIEDGHYKLIELTPDAYMGEGGAFSDAFELNGIGFNNGLKLLVDNCFRTT